MYPTSKEQFMHVSRQVEPGTIISNTGPRAASQAAPVHHPSKSHPPPRHFQHQPQQHVNAPQQTYTPLYAPQYPVYHGPPPTAPSGSYDPTRRPPVPPQQGYYYNNSPEAGMYQHPLTTHQPPSMQRYRQDEFQRPSYHGAPPPTPPSSHTHKAGSPQPSVHYESHAPQYRSAPPPERQVLYQGPPPPHRYSQPSGSYANEGHPQPQENYQTATQTYEQYMAQSESQAWDSSSGAGHHYPPPPPGAPMGPPAPREPTPAPSSVSIPQPYRASPSGSGNSVTAYSVV